MWTLDIIIPLGTLLFSCILYLKVHRVWKASQNTLNKIQKKEKALLKLLHEWTPESHQQPPAYVEKLKLLAIVEEFEKMRNYQH